MSPQDFLASRPRACNKRIWASVERDSGKVTEGLLEEAHRRDPEHKRPSQILKGKASIVAGGIRRSATLRGLSAKEREAVYECARY